MRDDFSAKIKEKLAKRVGFCCSNPGCRQPTSGPQDNTSGTINIGVAAHITAASESGPRFDSKLSHEARQSSENGIWLCQTCAKLIDSDINRYTVQKILEWKSYAERAAALALESRRSPNSDVDGIFMEALRLMPELIAEMKEDIHRENSELIREFVVLPMRNVMFNSSKPRFVYAKDEHENLLPKIDWLEEMGLIVD